MARDEGPENVEHGTSICWRWTRGLGAPTFSLRPSGATPDECVRGYRIMCTRFCLPLASQSCRSVLVTLAVTDAPKLMQC